MDLPQRALARHHIPLRPRLGPLMKAKRLGPDVIYFRVLQYGMDSEGSCIYVLAQMSKLFHMLVNRL